MTNLKYYSIVLILIFSFSLQNVRAENYSIQASKEVKALLHAQGIILEEIGNELYLLKEETPIIIFDRDAQYVIEIVADNKLTIESESAYAEIIFGSENIYITFIDKQKEKQEKIIF